MSKVITHRTFGGRQVKVAPFGIPTRRIKCLNTGQKFESIQQAAEWFEVVPASSICNVLRGYREFCKGLKFIYL